MKRYLILLFLFPPGILGFISIQHSADPWTNLFNGKDLTGWDTYIGPIMDDQEKHLTDRPIGLNQDPLHVFSVAEDRKEKVIRISGEQWGGISTKSEYENFHLHLQFKWGKLEWGSKKGKKKDSGLLYFAVGPHGADYGFWMRSQEFQIEEGNSGDYWGVAGGSEDVPTVKLTDSIYQYTKSGVMRTFNEASKIGRFCKKRTDAENPTGQWNTADLYCHGDTSVHVINGKVMMVLYHSSQLINGKLIPMAKGKIQIQSEGAEVFYKDLRIRALEALPKDLLH